VYEVRLCGAETSGSASRECESAKTKSAWISHEEVREVWHLTASAGETLSDTAEISTHTHTHTCVHASVPAHTVDQMKLIIPEKVNEDEAHYTWESQWGKVHTSKILSYD